MLPTRADLVGDPGLGGRRAQAGFQPRAELLEALVRRVVAQRAERARAGGRGQRIAAERAGLKHLAGRQHVVHDLGAAAVGPDGQAAADDLAERRQVGLDAQPLLRPAIGHAEAGHHFVADQQRAVLLA